MSQHHHTKINKFLFRKKKQPTECTEKKIEYLPQVLDEGFYKSKVLFGISQKKAALVLLEFGYHYVTEISDTGTQTIILHTMADWSYNEISMHLDLMYIFMSNLVRLNTHLIHSIVSCTNFTSDFR